ncbi:MAG TPA: cysteine-rich CWC family protein [Solirubrobacteraceae bacterium]|nr:cysteine-rich CWC family protein [Solirubrobacteraceae bacterium]
MPPASPTVPPDRCPRCGGAFACEIATGACWCAELTLSPARQAELATEYDGCLCAGCLGEIEHTSSPGSQPLV